jgi:hypothetical protein
MHGASSRSYAAAAVHQLDGYELARSFCNLSASGGLSIDVGRLNRRSDYDCRTFRSRSCSRQPPPQSLSLPVTPSSSLIVRSTHCNHRGQSQIWNSYWSFACGHPSRQRMGRAAADAATEPNADAAAPIRQPHELPLTQVHKHRFLLWLSGQPSNQRGEAETHTSHWHERSSWAQTWRHPQVVDCFCLRHRL